MSARLRGFIDDCCPRAGTRELLVTVSRILTEYRGQLPLTLRRTFYILVGRHGYQKTELAYSRLGELLNKDRRARLVDMNAIRDDGFVHQRPDCFNGVDQFIAAVSETATNRRLDRQKGERRRLALWCKGSGMVLQLVRVADPFGIEICSSGGFGSLTDKHRIARRWASDPVTALHIGDFDPRGVHCFSALAEDVTSLADHYGGDFQSVRLAVTREQAAEYRLEAAPPEPTDRRRFGGHKTFQVEALDPRDIAEIVRRAIEESLDRDTCRHALTEEEAAQQAVLARFGNGSGRPVTRPPEPGRTTTGDTVETPRVKVGKYRILRCCGCGPDNNALCGRRNCRMGGGLNAGTNFSCIGLADGCPHG